MTQTAFSQEQIDEASRQLDGKPPEEILRWAVKRFFPKLTMATAFGPEGNCIIHMLATIEPVHDEMPLGAVKDTRPILEKGDNFKVPEKKEPLRFVTEFLTGKGGSGQPSVEFRRRSAD